MVGAKVNGMIVPIDHVLVNGEIVEILTSAQSKGPSRDWLKIVKTGEARNKIRQWFKKEQRGENIAVGKAEIDRELKRYNRPYTEAQKSEIVLNVAKRIGISDVEDAYNIIGYGGLTVTKIAAKLRDEFDRVVKPTAVETEPSIEEIAEQNKSKHRKNDSGVIVDGHTGFQVKFSKCCNPIPGDEIIGFITKGFGISIHRADCPNVLSMQTTEENRERLVSAEWDKTANFPQTGFEARLQIICKNSMTVMANITSAIVEMRVTLLGMTMQNRTSTETVVLISFSCRNTEHLNQIVTRLKAVREVEEVNRSFS